MRSSRAIQKQALGQPVVWPLATQSVVSEPSVSPSPDRLLEMQSPGPHSRATEEESAFLTRSQ